MTPLKDYYNKKIEALDKVNVFEDISGLETGDFVYIKAMHGKSSALTGFVKKIARVNVILETTYGGWSGQDVILQELKVRKERIAEFLKPIK